MDFTGERFIPQGKIADEISILHLQRYISVQKICRGKRVLDIASGEGYGSRILAETADFVEGVDISEEAVLHARKTYRRDNLRFTVGSVTSIPAPDASFDVVVSFETIEHVGEKEQKQFLREVKRVLHSGGVFVISSPDKKNYSDIPHYKNEFHVHELYRDEFEALLKEKFSNVKLYDQAIFCNAIICDDLNEPLTDSKVLSLGFPPVESRAEYSLAICGDKGIPAFDNTVVPDPDNLYYRMKDLITALKGSVGDPGIIIEQKENYIQEQRQWLSERDDKIREQNGVIEQKENYIQEQRQWLSERDDTIRGQNGIVEQKENYIQEQRRQLSERDDTIRGQSVVIEQKESYIQEQRQWLSERDDTIREQNGVIEQKENYIQEQRQRLSEQDDTIRKQSGVIEERNDQLLRQEKHIQKLERFINSFPVDQIFKLYDRHMRKRNGTDGE